MILLSSHKDTVKHDYALSYEKGVHMGLLDNFIGILVSYLTIYDDKSLIELEKQGKIRIWHGDGEEFGLLRDYPKMTKKDLVVVVDVADGPVYKNVDISLENISGISDKQIKEWKESLEWEGFKVLTKKYTGKPDDEDEAWKWRELGIPVLSFIIPINCGKEYQWHTDNCEISSEGVLKARQILKRFLCYAI